MGPVLRAVDDGHYQRGRDASKGKASPLTCRACESAWPCRVIVLARNAQRDYADALRQRNAIEAGKLSVR